MTTLQPHIPESIGRYKILRLLGSGAMGDVFLAEDLNIGRQLAIKTVRVVGGTETDISERKHRLLREARAAGKLLHPNVVALFDADEAEGVLYLAFEYVEGLDLSQRVGVPPLLSLRQVLTIGREVATALDYAHRSDIVHRDIKPSNILLGPGGEAKVADFGIAKLTGSTELTRTGSVVGSPQYMSPEQVRGEALDGRSDLFSLGVVLYELLCRARPFGGDTISTLVYEILAKEPHTVDQLRPGLPARLVTLVHGLLAKDRQHRPTTGAHVIAELDAIVAEAPSELLDGPAAPPAGDEGETIRMPSSGGMSGPVPAPGSSSSV
ncbi:MAG: serine/threonine-protein kinase, partial [Acidobacteriota bacterium]